MGGTGVIAKWGIDVGFVIANTNGIRWHPCRIQHT